MDNIEFDYDDMYKDLVENDYFRVTRVKNIAMNDQSYYAKRGEVYQYLEIYLKDKYCENYSVTLDEELNKIIKKYVHLSNLLISSSDWKVPMSLKTVLEDNAQITNLSILTFLDQKQYKNAENLDLYFFRANMYDIYDIDLLKFKQLHKCIIILHKEHSSKEVIQNSQKYINELQNLNPSIDYTLRID